MCLSVYVCHSCPCVGLSHGLGWDGLDWVGLGQDYSVFVGWVGLGAL